MPQQSTPPPKPFGPRGPDKVGVENVQHQGTLIAAVEGDLGQCDDDGRKQQMPGLINDPAEHTRLPGVDSPTHTNTRTPRAPFTMTAIVCNSTASTNTGTAKSR